MTSLTEKTEQAYTMAKDRYGDLNVDTEKAIEVLQQIPLSIHCWQGDDVQGFEGDSDLEGSGLQTTGGYSGAARTPDELRQDFEKAHSLIPGTHRINLHAIYAETGDKKVERNDLQPKHFQNWIDWAKDMGIGMDMNPTFFAHPMAKDGFTLASYNKEVRQYWVEHGIACRKIGEAMGKALGKQCVENVWIPDGYKDIPVDRRRPRELLTESLDAIFAEKIDKQYLEDSVESKLFGIGSESYVVGSHDFYVGYAMTHDVLYTIDTGHFHPTESTADKLSALFNYFDELFFHISRGVRWDSDHVVLFNDDVQSLTGEMVRGDYLDRVRIGLDFFDASINRVAAWVIGSRSVLKSLLYSLLEPVETLKEFERSGDFTSRLAYLEEMKTLPFGAVWDYYCLNQDAPVSTQWLDEVKQYESDVLANRG